MTLFWPLTVLLSILAASFVILPLIRQRRDTSDVEDVRTETNLALYEERLAELDAELNNANLDQPQYDILLVELKRSLLADVESDDKTPATIKKPARKNTLSLASKSLWLPLAMVLAMPIFSYALYQQWGFLEEVSLAELYEQTMETENTTEQLTGLIVSLGNVVKEDESNAWAWYFLGVNFTNVGMYTEAGIAFERSSSNMEDGGEKAMILGQTAQLKYIEAQGVMTDEVHQIIAQARDLVANEGFSLQLLSLDAEQREDYPEAISYWRLMIQANPNSAEATALRVKIAQAQQFLGGDDLLASRDISVADGPKIDVEISLAEGIQLPDELRIFVAARNAAQEGLPPLAAIDLTVADLPITIRLDNSSAMVPAFNLSSADTLYISALVSFAGTASPLSGDYQVISGNFSHNNQHTVIGLVISEQLP